MVRESTLAAYFGASSDTDAYKIAYSIPGIIFVIINAAITQTLIPVYNERLKISGKEQTNRFLNNIITLTGIITIVLILLCLAGSRIVVRFIAPGLDFNTMEKSIRLMRIMMPFSFFIIISNIISAYLQANEHFIPPALTSLPYGIIGILSIIFFHSYGIKFLGYGSAIAFLLMFVIQLPVVRMQGFKYRFIIDLKDESLITVKKLIIPVIISSSFSQIYMIVNRILASSLDEGSISALDYATKVNTVFFNVFTVPLATVLFSKLSSNNDNKEKFIQYLNNALRIGTITSLPVTTGLVVLRVPIIRFLFERGEFTPYNTLTTSIALSGLALGTIGVTFSELLNRAFFALKDTKTPMFIGTISIILNIAISLSLVKKLGIAGIALGTSVSAIICGCFLLFRLRNKLKHIKGKSLLSVFAKSIFASIIMGVLISLIQNVLIPKTNTNISFISTTINLLISVSIGGLLYLVILYMIKVEEIYSGIDFMRKKIGSFLAADNIHN